MSLFRKLTPLLQMGLARYSSNITPNLHKVNNLEKRMLVWTGKFKTIGEVPAMVAGEMVEKARNRMRIRIANIMMAVTLLACLVVSIQGKRAHERGESVTKSNLAWHAAYNEENKDNKEKVE